MSDGVTRAKTKENFSRVIIALTIAGFLLLIMYFIAVIIWPSESAKTALMSLLDRLATGVFGAVAGMFTGGYFAKK